MADNVLLNAGSGGSTLSSDEIAGIHHQRIKIQYGIDGSATDASHTSPLPVIAGMASPQVSTATSVALAAGSSTDLDSTQITSTKTGKLIAVLAASSVPLKVEIKTVLNGVPSSALAVFFLSDNHLMTLPSREFITQVESATAGLDGFRCTITNLDTSQSADVYATFFYDEV